MPQNPGKRKITICSLLCQPVSQIQKKNYDKSSLGYKLHKTGTSLLVSTEGSEILKHPGCLWIFVPQHKQGNIFLLFQRNEKKKKSISSKYSPKISFAVQLGQSNSHQRSCPSPTSCPDKLPPFAGLLLSLDQAMERQRSHTPMVWGLN